jgi:hypothetical protein
MGHANLKSFGVLLDVEVHDESLGPAVDLLLPPGWEASDEFPQDGHFTLAGKRDGEYSVLVDGEPAGAGLGADVALHVLDAQIRLRIGAVARDHVFVHAGVVAVGDRALVMPGETFCGKSTLVAALVAKGATYYSDEYAVLDKTGAVHPYARRLSIRDVDGGSGWGHRRSVEELGGIAGTSPARPVVIALTAYVSGERWEPQRRNPGIGALALWRNSFVSTERPEESMKVLTRAAADAQVLEGKRGEAVETAAALMHALTEGAAPLA